jgi:hypothetical protein
MKRAAGMHGHGVSIIKATEDDSLFARWFRKRETWAAWFAFLKVLFGLPLDAGELETFRQCTGRSEPPVGGTREAHLICGRRAGKSFVLALTAVYLACFKDWRGCFAPGERGTIVIIAADRKQGRVIFRYISALLRIPLLVNLIERSGVEFVDLTNHTSIEIQTASFRTTRGYSVIAALCDELAFWRTGEGSSNPDTEIIAALRPAMSTIPGSMLLCASSPYARKGELWTAFRKHFGKDGDPVLVWKAPTRVMNSTVPESFVAEAYENDPASAAAEYGAEFRSDVETFVSREAVEAAVMHGRLELPPLPRARHTAFCDPSGGSSDSMTLAIAHLRSDGCVVLDAIREVKAPFSPESVVAEFCVLLKSYRITTVCGDRYGGEWPRERFQVHGVRYEVSEKAKSDLYIELLPLLNSRRTELLDHARLLNQLVGLERRTARSGRDSIDHPPGGRDDVVNAAAGALVLAATDASAWMRSEVMRPVIQRLQMMGPYRRTIDPDQRAASAMARIGERRFLQIQRSRGF